MATRTHPDDGIFDDGFSVTTNDSADLSEVALLFIGTPGSLKVTTAKGTTLTYENVPVGFFPVRVKKVFATGTTAADIIGNI
jgi:hypothetical protein